MRRLALIGLLALSGCGEDEPSYSAIICLEDRNKEQLIEKDFTRFFKQNGYGVDYLDYTTGMSASKYWGGRAYLFFDFAGDVRSAEEPSLIATHLYLDRDDPLVREYKSLIEQNWGGYERPGRSYRGNECDSRHPEMDKATYDTVLVP